MPQGVANDNLLHLYLAAYLYTPKILFPDRREAAAQFHIGIQLAIEKNPFLERESLRQGSKVYRRMGIERNVGVSQQVIDTGIGKNVGMGSLEMENTKVEV